MDKWTRVKVFIGQHRRKLGALVAAVGLAVVGAQLVRQLPTDTHIRYDLGPDHATVKEVRVAFSTGNETTVRSLSRRFPDGAPQVFDDTVSLPRGRYRVHALIIRDGGQVRGILRGIELPADGEVRIDLFDRAFAQRGP